MTQAKRLAVLVVATAVAFGAAACGSDGSDAGGSKGEKQYVAMSFANGDVQIWNDTLKLMKPQIEKAGYGFLTANPQNKAETQASQWQAWIQRGDVKAIMGFPVQADALVPVTKQAKDAGVSVISYASTWDGASTGLTVDDFASGEKLGKEAGAWITKSGKKDVTVAVLTDRRVDLGVNRAKGIIAGIKATAPDAKIKELGIPGASREVANTAAKAQIAADPNTKVWLGFSDDPIKGAYQALIDSGVAKDDPTYFLGSLDATEESLKLLAGADSIYRAAFIVTAQDIADLNVRLLLAGAKGEPVKAETVEYVPVTSENASDFLK